ncbi:MAG TPA: threonine--tRNA ligase [Thermoplasmata archaeon]|nr:threonine--tRNA ligase [Thermoplasmata archaeon]
MAAGANLVVVFPDGRQVEAKPGTLAGELLAAWSPERAGHALAALWNGKPVDLTFRVAEKGSLAPLTFEDRAGWEVLQHSAAHLLAKAVVETIPDALPTQGPPTDDGFFYDFDVRPLTPGDLDAIDAAMKRSVAAREPFSRRELDRSEAERLFARNPYKLRYIADVPPGEPVSVYDTGTFTDLCRGPHVPNVHWLRGVHVLGFSAITPDRPEAHPLQRIRGVGFPTRPELDEYLKIRAEAVARDHRTIGQRQELFVFADHAPGFPFWLPNGMVIVRELEKFVQEHLRKAGYSEIRTPLLFARSVFETSGHWDHYRENMFVSVIEGKEYGWKPMNCPGAMLIFGSRARSYRELPLRLAEFAPLHRYEASGTLHGLMRVRELVQDDAHIFLTEEQIEPEIRVLLEWVKEACATFRLTWSAELSTRPATFLGEAADWDRAEAVLGDVLRSAGVEFRASAGEGAFYAPKIDIHLKDSLGRPWQTGTIQLDYQMPRRFHLEYQGADGRLHTPIVVHRTILGTWERFVGVLTEHVAGRWPPWLAPIQVRVLPVTDAHSAAARGVVDELRAEGIRVDLAPSDESLPKRVRAAELDRIPYVVVLGDREVADGSVSVRIRGSKVARMMSRPEFLAHVADRVRRRDFDP